MRVILTILVALLANKAESKSETTSYSLSWHAQAPNAGGQQAYALRRSTDNVEWVGFANTYLLAGGYPLVGATYNLRLPICGHSCFWQAYIQAGAGISSGGPLLEMTWSTTLLWVARLDFTTQMFVIPTRLISWSYPAWLGVSIPIP